MNTSQPPDWRPPHAYVPGQTKRHAEDLFAAIRAGCDPQAPLAGAAFRFGRAFLRDGYFWEAHEVLEPVWMACPRGSPERRLVQALIQLANAGLKRRMNRPRAVARLLQMADGLAAGLETDLAVHFTRLRPVVSDAQLAAIPVSSPGTPE